MLTVAELMRGVDRTALMRLCHDAELLSDPTHRAACKFGNWHMYAGAAISQMCKAEVIEPEPKLRILDVGCGAGYFVRGCTLIGHIAHGLTISAPFYHRACKLLGVKPFWHWVEAFEPIPPHLQGYDRIELVGFGMPKHSEDKPPWTVWEFFISDLLSRLKQGGILRCELNHGRPWQVKPKYWQESFGGVAKIRADGNHFRLEKL